MEEQCAQYSVFPPFLKWGKNKKKKPQIIIIKNNNFCPVNKVHRLLAGIMQTLQ